MQSRSFSCLNVRDADALISGQIDAKRAGALRAHALSCPSCRGLLERRSGDDAATTDGDAGGWGSADAGPAIPGYSIERELQRGGQGVVYAALQASTGRRVALKVLPWLDATPRARRRFEREIELASSLHHANVVTVFDGGEAPGYRWFAMELVEGSQLGAWLLEQPRSLQEKLRVFVDICSAVDHAHARGVLHRDLKPANILVTGLGEPRVLDFGLARPLGEEAGPPVTVTGTFAGTLTHASPEQVRGDSRAIDTRTDVYSLGVILYEMLTGSLPVSAGHDFTDGLRRIEIEEPVPPSARTRGLDKDLDTVCLRALAKDPARRYSSVASLRNDVQAVLDGRPIEARRDSAFFLVSRTARRHRLALVGALILIAGQAAALAAVRAERDRALRAQEEMRQAAVARQEAMQLLVDMLTRTGRGEHRTVPEMAAWAADGLPARFKDDDLARARVEASLAAVFVGLGDATSVERGRVLARDAVRTLRQAGPSRELAEALYSLGAALRRGHGGMAARVAFEQALGVALVAVPDDRALMAKYKAGAVVGLRPAENPKALGLLDGALEDALATAGPVGRPTRVIRLLRTSRLHEAGRLTEAELSGRELVRDEWTAGLVDVQHVSSLSELARVLEDSAPDSPEIVSLRAQAFATVVATRDREHPAVAEAETNLAHALLRRGEVVSACALLTHAAGNWPPPRLREDSELWQAIVSGIASAGCCRGEGEVGCP